MSDRTLTCRDCGQEFVFTVGEQEFYQQRGFSEPQRCGTCRQARKTQRNAGGGGYSDSGYGGGGSSYGGGSSSYGGGNSYGGGDSSYSSGGGGGDRGGYSSGPRQLYAATCSECGQETQVPFAPTPGKPVYCRDCFQSRKQASSFGNRW